MISVYDMTHEEENGFYQPFSKKEEKSGWIQTISVSQGHIRELFIEACPKLEQQEQLDRDNTREAGETEDKQYSHSKNATSLFERYQLLCITGTHHTRSLRLNMNGQLQKVGQAIPAPGRIIRVKADSIDGTGMIMLCDSE